MTTQLNDPTCADCRFWQRLQSRRTVNCLKRGAVPLGHCRRSAPTISNAILREEMETTEIDDETVFIASRFPIVADDDWCGKFQPTGERTRAENRDYRIGREAEALSKAATAVAAAEKAEDEWAVENSRRALTQIDERLVREVPGMVAEIRERAKSFAISDAARALIDWAPLDNALAEASGQGGGGLSKGGEVA